MSKPLKTETNQERKEGVDQNIDTLPLAAQQALKEAQARKRADSLANELNGPKGLEPTRYGDWEAKGRCYDF